MTPNKTPRIVSLANEAETLLRLMQDTVTPALDALATPLGSRAVWLLSFLLGDSCAASKLYLLKLIGEDMEEDLSQLLPLEEDQIGPYDKEVEIMEDAIEAARDFWNRYRNAEEDR